MVSESPQGPGWWVASDGRYYPPEQHPSYRQHMAAQHAAAQYAPSQQTAGQLQVREAKLASPAGPMFTAGLVSAAVVVVGALLPWATVSTAFGTVSVNGTEGDGVLTLGGGVVAAALLLFGRGRKGAAVVAAIVGMLVTLVGVYDLANVSSAAAEAANQFARGSAGAGLWLTVVGGGAMTLCSAVAAARANRRG